MAQDGKITNSVRDDFPNLTREFDRICTNLSDFEGIYWICYSEAVVFSRFSAYIPKLFVPKIFAALTGGIFSKYTVNN